MGWNSEHARNAALLALSIVFQIGAASAADGDRRLNALFKEWRAFAPPPVESCVPDYGAEAMAEKAADLEIFKTRLAAMNKKGWRKSDLIDAKLVAAEMNGMDFDLRVLRPWARDPSYYATVWTYETDVPENEGPSIHPVIDLWRYDYPLSERDQEELTCLIGAVPALLEQARTNLAASNARDLWVYGDRAFRIQSAALEKLATGDLDLSTRDGAVRADMTGAGAPLMSAIAEAKTATDAFRQWLKGEAPKKTGPSGVGKEDYSWHAKNVQLSPYDWEAQATLLRRELERARASLALEEFRNRNLPPLEPIDDAEAWEAMAAEKMARVTDFLIDSGFVEDKECYRAAMAAKTGGYTPPENRNFFAHGMARDPSALYAHDYHWIELARRKYEPGKRPIRAAAPLYDIYADRSEGMATAMEELLLHAGYYDDNPRGREIVWVMLANRAARGLSSLYVQANEMTLEEAGKFHARWTPRGWTNPESDLVAFEQLLYLRQPGYGTSYITGKAQFDALISAYAFDRERGGGEMNFADFFKELNGADIIPFSLIESEMTRAPIKDGRE